MITKKTLKTINRAINNPRETSKKLVIKLFSNFGNTDYRRFMILSRTRTGSTMLLSLLNSHPNVYAEGEIFRALNGRNYKDILTKVYTKLPSYIKAKGFKIFYFDPIDDDSNNIWGDLISMEDLWVIHLKRRNILRTILSRKIAGTQGVWAVWSAKEQNSDKDKAVSFTKEELEQSFINTRDAEEKGNKDFNKHTLLTVYYEDLVTNTEDEFRKIFDFLGVEYVLPKTNSRKQNSESLRYLIKNYDELKLAFTGTKWQDFFDV